MKKFSDKYKATKPSFAISRSRNSRSPSTQPTWSFGLYGKLSDCCSLLKLLFRVQLFLRSGQPSPKCIIYDRPRIFASLFVPLGSCPESFCIFLRSPFSLLLRSRVFSIFRLYVAEMLFGVFKGTTTRTVIPRSEAAPQLRGPRVTRAASSPEDAEREICMRIYSYIMEPGGQTCHRMYPGMIILSWGVRMGYRDLENV